jgi:electron transfer flavoprotein beta subunit
LVVVKRVVDYNIKVRPTADGKAVDIASVKMSINPFDEIALEEALRLKEAGHATEVVAVAVGTAQSQDVLRHALAMGADRVILLETPTITEPLATAKLLKALVAQEAPQLVLIGKQAVDDDAAETGQMLAALLNVGQATFASKIVVQGDNTLVVTREIDGGQETLSLRLPAVVTTDLRLNEPRYVKLPNLMMAKKKPITTLSAADFGLDIAPRLQLLKVEEPAQRGACVMLANVAELVGKLREARVLAEQE